MLRGTRGIERNLFLLSLLEPLLKLRTLLFVPDRNVAEGLHDHGVPALLRIATSDETVATEGRWWSAYNPEVRGSTVYASWFSDGVRVIDISDPSSPRETSSWTGEGTPEDAPAVEIWSVVPHGDLLLASDRNYGLYILKHTS